MKRPALTVYASAMLALSAAFFLPATATAQTSLSIVIGDAPPPPRFESVPRARSGYLWAPGYWSWDGHRHVWSAGHWEAERRGQQFRPAEWVRIDNGWQLRPGGWIAFQATAGDGYLVSAPPPPRYERIPPPRPGYLWAPGYWEWRGHRHEWVGGRWLVERPGYRYNPPHWAEREGRWYRDEERWERHDHERGPGRGHGDRDHDGVPDRHDRDRDGDGVPNRYDRRPDNPRRD